MNVLVLNAGSSSLRASVVDPESGETRWSARLEELGERERGSVLRLLADALDPHRGPHHRFDAVGHRIVHGGGAFAEAAVITEEVIDAIRSVSARAPLHNGPALEVVEAAAELVPDLPHVAVFDTAFHQRMPPHAYRYAVPAELYERFGVRRFGFHGTSHRFVAHAAADLLARPLEQLRLVTLHLGNGASAAAIDAGHSVDTSMGMTPLEGLVMGTRSGDVDPALPGLLSREAGMSVEEVERLLTHASGLRGLCGTSDLRQVRRLADAGDADAQLALDVFCHRIRKYVGAYLAVLGGADAVVFTGGIGENDHIVRERVCSGLEALGIALDPERNRATVRHALDVAMPDSAVRVIVARTNEELEIARQTAELLKSRCGLSPATPGAPKEVP